jgi:cell division protein FtsW
VIEMGKVDGVLLTFVLFLVLGGVVMVYSSSAILAQDQGGSETSYLRSQMEKAAVGIVLMFVFSRMPIRLLYGRGAWWALAAAGLLLVLLLLPVGLAVKVRDTRRFLNLGIIKIQPAEFARLALLIFLAYYASHKEEWFRKSWRSLIVPLGAVAGVAGLTALQPNLSSAVLMGMLGFAVLLLGGQPLRRLILLVVPVVAAAPFLMKAYQVRRILKFGEYLGGGSESLPYQVKQSLIAVGSGGLMGRGIGQGLQKYHYLPFPHTDFILGIVGEETGFLGLLVLFTFYGFVLMRGLRIARYAPDRFSQLLALGLTMSVALNLFLHSVVVLGLGPVTGVPLPFISHGGSSLLVNLISMGILLSISRQARPAQESIPRAWNPRGGSLRAN